MYLWYIANHLSGGVMFESLVGFINYKGEGNFNKAIGFLTSCKNMLDEALENDISSGLKNNLNLSYHHSLKKAMKYCCLFRFLHKMETCYFNLTVSPIERIYLPINSQELNPEFSTNCQHRRGF